MTYIDLNQQTADNDFLRKKVYDLEKQISVTENLKSKINDMEKQISDLKNKNITANYNFWEAKKRKEFFEKEKNQAKAEVDRIKKIVSNLNLVLFFVIFS